MECSECCGRGRINAAGRIESGDANSFDCDACDGTGEVYDCDCDCAYCDNARRAAATHERERTEWWEDCERAEVKLQHFAALQAWEARFARRSVIHGSRYIRSEETKANVLAAAVKRQQASALWYEAARSLADFRRRVIQ